jgi:hypothetical protein
VFPLAQLPLSQTDPSPLLSQPQRDAMCCRSSGTVGSYFNATCSHLNTTSGQWDREGCEAYFLTKVTRQAFCRCAHLTQFSVQQIPVYIFPVGAIPEGAFGCCLCAAVSELASSVAFISASSVAFISVASRVGEHPQSMEHKLLVIAQYPK